MKTDYKKAYEFIQKDFDKEEIFSALKNDDDIKKIAVVLNLEKLSDEETASLLVYNLTNQSGPVREACAYKISELIVEYKTFFQDEKTLNIVIASLNDVNPNVVRFMLNALKHIDNKEYIFDKLTEKIKDLYTEILNKPRRGKAEEHVFTKKCFKIYWSLESIKMLISEKSDIISDDGRKHAFVKILNDLCEIEEYTVREKIAQIVKMIEDEDFEQIGCRLKSDTNYFVKRHSCER